MFIILTKQDLFLYNKFPFFDSKLPDYTYSWPIIQIRLIYLKPASAKLNTSVKKPNFPHSGSSIGSLQGSTCSTYSTNSEQISFVLRIGTALGIETKLFLSQTYSEVSKFSLNLITTTHDYIRQLQTITFRKYTPPTSAIFNWYLLSACLCGAIESVLTLHYENGISILNTKTGEITHRISYQQLTSINDDNERKTTLNYEKTKTVSKSAFFLIWFLISDFVLAGTWFTTKPEILRMHPLLIHCGPCDWA